VGQAYYALIFVAVLAVFGVPAAHEDDPERAVRAALEMQTVAQSFDSAGSSGPALKLRIGVETGEVLVDRTRAAAERDLFVTGDAVNVAARLQSASAPGRVVVGPTTYAATRDAIDYIELPASALKGKVAPGPMTYFRMSTDDRRGIIKSYLGEGDFTDDPVNIHGGVAICHIPNLQGLMKYLTKNGFEHHIAMTRGHYADVLEEAISTYLKWDLFRHQ